MLAHLPWIVLAAVAALGTGPDTDDGAAEARAVFERAASAQCADASLPPIVSFKGEMAFVLFEKEEDGREKRRTGNIVQYWSRRDGEFGYRRELTHDGRRQPVIMAVSYDDVYWRIDRNGRRQVMRTREWKEDKKRLEAEKRQVRHLFGLFILRQLKFDASSLRLVAAKQPLTMEIAREEITCETAVIELEDLQGNRIRLWIRTDDHHLARARVTPKDHPDYSEEFRMAYHYEVPVGRSDAKVALPFRVLYLEKGEPKLQITARRIEKLQLNGLDEKERTALFVP